MSDIAGKMYKISVPWSGTGYGGQGSSYLPFSWWVISSAKVQKYMYCTTSTVIGTMTGPVTENTKAMNVEDCSVR